MNSYQNLYYKSRKKTIDDVIKQSSNDELFKSLLKIDYPNEFDKKFNLLRDDVDILSMFINLLVRRGIPRSEITIENRLINVDGNVDLRDLGLTKIPHPFGIVTGHFTCSKNKLTTLDGSPQEVGRIFSCYDNQLTTLEGAPLKVGGNFHCESNKLTTLKGAPLEVGGSFYCYNNELTTLDGSPQQVGGNFWCTFNKLTTLEGAPLEVVGDFKCSQNQKKFTEYEVRQYSKVNGDINV